MNKNINTGFMLWLKEVNRTPRCTLVSIRHLPVPPCSLLACAFCCYQRNLALYQDSFYIICYHYIASNQIHYYCCFHLARHGTPTPSLWRYSSVLGSTFLMLSLNFPLLLTQSPSPHRCLETAMLPPPMSSFG